MRELTIGVVVARTGRLAQLGEALAFAMGVVGPKVCTIINGKRRYDCRLVSRDSASQPAQARRVTKELIDEERAHLIVTLAGTQILPVVADTCEELETPCLSTAFPWQAYYYGRGATDERPLRWTYHFCWGLDDIACVFADMWDVVGSNRRVGCLWNDAAQGRWLRHPEVGFLPAAASRGYTMIDPGGYREPAGSLADHLSVFEREGVDVVTSAATAPDLALFRQQAAAHGLRLRLITCSRWLAYPPGTSGMSGVATLVYWTPRHPYHSSLDGMSSAELAHAYEAATGRQWLQLLGLAHALFEVAVHALATADDPHDRQAIVDAIAHARLETMAGPLDWAKGPVPNVAMVRLAGGQWKPGTRDAHELQIVTNSGCADLPLDDDLQLLH